jgi:hypothetical protein
MSGEAAPAGDAGMGGEMGGMPPEAAAGAGAPMGGEPSQEEALQELAMALQELGISPEELMQSMGGAAGGGAPMGGDVGGGEMPAPKMAAANELKTIGAAVADFKRSGLFEIKEARTKRARELRDNMKAYVRELVSR